MTDIPKFPSESSLKRSAGVPFVIIEEEELFCEVAESGKRGKKSNDGDGSKMATSTGGLTTEIGLSQIDDMVRQGPSSSHFRVLVFEGSFVECELPPREQVFSREDFPAGSKYYGSHSAKTLLKDFTELNLSTVLDFGHTTTSLSADQRVQFACAVGSEVTQASYRLPEDLLVRSRRVGSVNVRGVTRRSPFLSFVGSTRGESVASQSKYSLPTVTGLTGLSASVTGFRLLRSPVNKPCSSQTVHVNETIDLEDRPLAVLFQLEKKMTDQKKFADPCKLSRRKCRPNPDPR